MKMIVEVERQFTENPELLVAGSTTRPDYETCVAISTKVLYKASAVSLILI
jgi:Na+/H+-translocating membrane pyrophosphatase